MDSNFQPLCVLEQQIPQALSVRVIPKNGLAIIATLDHVMGIAGYSQTSLAGHGLKLIGI
jgi:hypothetical protein